MAPWLGLAQRGQKHRFSASSQRAEYQRIRLLLWALWFFRYATICLGYRSATAVPDREEGVTAKEDPYGWYREGPIGSDFHIQKCFLIYLISLLSTLRHAVMMPNKEILFSLFAASCTPHADCSSAPVSRCEWHCPMRIL